MGNHAILIKWFIRISTSLIITLLAPTAFSEEPINTLEALRERVADIQQEEGVAALGVALVDRGELVWLDAMGQAHQAQQIPATPDTLFRIGSTSKMFVALAVLKLVEEGRLDLDTPLRELAPEIEFQNRWEDKHPVRLAHLLEHTTGWHDMRFVEYAHNDEQPIGLAEALTLFPESRESRWVPGTRSAYCNTGPAVAAYVVEKITGMPFENYVREEFFTPLGMTSASYCKPENPLQRSATAYVQGEPQDYWHIIYRPSGAINASAREMANLLQFFLQRGELNGQRLLPEASIDRMETPKTTLANELGVTAGYGLANYTSGFEDYGVSFHGHNGGVMGANSDFSYAPEINGGYALMTTGNPAAIQKLGQALRAYLLREHPKPELDPPPLPDSFRKLDGLYTPINPRLQRMEFLPAFLGAMTFSTDKTFLHRFPLAGGWESASNDYALNDQVLIEQWTGLPAIAQVEDPLAGDTVQVRTTLYKKTSALLVWGELLFFGSVFLLSALAIVYALFWVPLHLYRKTFRHPSVSLRFWPTLTSALLFATPAVIASSSLDFTAFVAWSHLSVSLFVLTLGYGLASTGSVFNLVRLRHSAIKRRIRYPMAILSLLHLAMTLYLASYGMIGLQLWTW
ncbi:serine hydrolase domain-containing protein [Marinimicrobium agarilyticum]|uniref:serine hydrolase domain-containing protein n=1 Tax=Marinimicrobium agarilyticum TaxID=306546 RepID=UPI000418D7D9|nr:serine hydrolase domain-containing protein [Marinimicrobium agarilyticum]